MAAAAIRKMRSTSVVRQTRKRTRNTLRRRLAGRGVSVSGASVAGALFDIHYDACSESRSRTQQLRLLANRGGRQWGIANIVQDFAKELRRKLENQRFADTS